MPNYIVTLYKDDGEGLHTCAEEAPSAFEAIVKRVENNGLRPRPEYGGVLVSAVEAPEKVLDEEDRTTLFLDTCLAQIYLTNADELKIIELNGEDQIPDSEASLETLAERYPFGSSVDFGGQHPRPVLGVVMISDGTPALSINASNDGEIFRYGIVRFDNHPYVRRVD